KPKQTMKKILQCCLWVLALFLAHSHVAAQSTVSGTVLNASDQTPMPGVTVAVKGKTQGTVTDRDGRFTITADPDDVLVFSFVGMETQEVQVGTSREITISLNESIASLQEIVVVGYGTQKKSNVTGAVSSVDTKVLDSR